MQKTPAIPFDDLVALVSKVQKQIEPEFRAMPDDAEPGICLTVGSDGLTWGYQTGDNSFTGGAYGYHAWGVGYIYEDSDPTDIAQAIYDELTEALCLESYSTEETATIPSALELAQSSLEELTALTKGEACDHEVGICFCSTFTLIDNLKAFIHEQTNQEQAG